MVLRSLTIYMLLRVSEANEVPTSYHILPNFSDFVNSDVCIGKITSKYIRLQPDFIEK